MAFLPYIFISPPLDGIFLVAYATAVVVSFLVPLRNRENQFVSASGLYTGAVLAIFAVCFVSGQMILIAGLFLGDPSKYIGSLFIFFSMIPIAASPYRLSKMGGRLRIKGIAGVVVADETQSQLDHFSLDFSTQSWFRHGSFSLAFLAFLGSYYYGWSFLGLPALLYSVSLLSPFLPSELADRLESAYPTSKSKRFTLGPRATLVTIIVLSFLAIASLVQNPFTGNNFLVFLVLAVSNAAYLAAYLVTGRSANKSSKHP
jgi:hypothetical protein